MKAKTKPKFSYDARRASNNATRRIAVSKFSKAVVAAYTGDTKQLCGLLRSGPALNSADWNHLADLIYLRIQKPKPRRKRVVLPRSVEEMYNRVFNLSQVALDRLRKQNGGKVPAGGYDATVASVWESVADEYPGLHAPNFDGIISNLRSKSKSKNARASNPNSV
jgi:hypothetical protein